MSRSQDKWNEEEWERNYGDVIASDGYTVLTRAEESWVGRSFADVMHPLLDLVREKEKWSPQCESPIEADIASRLAPLLPEWLTLVPQHPFYGFRMDFAILFKGKAALFIECDGKEFHSTPEQIQNDAKKDVCALEAGIPLLRFTGSEIFRKPQACCNKILAVLGGEK